MALKETKTVVTESEVNRNAPRAPRIDEPVRKDLNRDPISGAPGAHPVGVGIGAAAAGAAGAAIGSIVPGVGTVIGAAIGAIVGAVGGGYAGKGIAEVVDPTAEDAYWKGQLSNRPYYDERFNYEDDYGPAYGYGYAMRAERADAAFEDAEPELRDQWQRVRGKSQLEWDRARGAVSDAWTRYDELERQRADAKRGTIE